MERYDKKPEKTIEDYIRESAEKTKQLDAYKNTGLTPEQVEILEDCNDMQVARRSLDEQKIIALTADKDEQAGRIMRMDYLLRRTLPILEATNNQQELIEAIDALLGGKEDA